MQEAAARVPHGGIVLLVLACLSLTAHAAEPRRHRSAAQAPYQTGMLRQRRGSLTAQAAYDRSGNASPHADQSVYIDQRLWVRTTVGLNLTHAWQVAYTFFARKVKVIGGRLQGYGESRFYGRGSFSANIEFRQRLLALNALGTRIELEVAPFFDTGGVFSHNSAFPIDKLHNVAGIGFRGIAAPFVVGYVDVGYGSEGAAVFSGINHPF